LLCFAAACAPRYVEGLSLTVGDRLLAVSRSTKGHDAVVNSGEPARFAFEQAVAFPSSGDFSVFVRGSGRLTIRLFSGTRDKVPVAVASFDLLAGLAAELRMAVPEGLSVAAAEITVVEGSTATISAFAVLPAFAGIRFGSGAYTVDGGTTFSVSPQPGAASIVLDVSRNSDTSLVIVFAANGKARVDSVGSNGNLRPIFDIVAAAGSPVALPVASLGGAVRVSVESGAGITSATLERGGVAPLSDLHAMLAVTKPVDGDFLLYRWDILPGTLVFDFADYQIQDRYLKRLAFFTEKPGFRGRLAADDEIEALHGWNAHDYSPGSLAAFFTKARDTGFNLNAEETTLLELLVSYGVITRDADGALGEGRGAIISITRESTDSLRRTFLDHESSHALFFQDAEYRKLAARLWASLGPEAKRFWLKHFNWRRYDTRDEYLCINELQAYLVQQSTQATRSYYETVTKWLVEAYPDEGERIEADAVFAIESAVADARTLDAYLREHWGLSAGRFGRIRRP